MTSILVNEELVAEAMQFTGAATEQEAVETTLRERLQLAKQARAAEELFGSFHWQGDLEQSRLGHVAE